MILKRCTRYHLHYILWLANWFAKWAMGYSSSSVGGFSSRQGAHHRRVRMTIGQQVFFSEIKKRDKYILLVSPCNKRADVWLGRELDLRKRQEEDDGGLGRVCCPVLSHSFHCVFLTGRTLLLYELQCTLLWNGSENEEQELSIQVLFQCPALSTIWWLVMIFETKNGEVRHISRGSWSSCAFKPVPSEQP